MKKTISIQLLILFLILTTSKSSYSEESLQTVDWPSLAFPWAINTAEVKGLWRFNSSAHSYDGPNFPEKTWSGIDFGVPLFSDDRKVRATESGFVIAINPGCSVVIAHNNVWETRSLHITDIIVKEGDTVKQGQIIGTIDPTPCADADAPHLHLDIRRDGQYYPIDGLPIGGWIVHSHGGHYNGFLERDGFVIEANVKDLTGKLKAQIFNTGEVGLGGNPLEPIQYENTGLVCADGICQPATEETKILREKLRGLDKFFPWVGIALHLWKRSSEGNQIAETDNFACIDFDTEELYRYNFPGTTLSLLQNATEASVMLGDCDPSTRPVKDDGFATGGFNEGLVTSSCGNIPFFAVIDDDGTCYVPPPGLPFAPVTLPFNPIKVKFWRAEDGNLSLFDRQGNCTPVGDGTHAEYDVSGNFYRLVFGPCDFSFGRNDLPVIYGKFASKHIEPPVITWQISDQDLNKAIRSRIRLYKVPSSGQKVLLKDLTLPHGVYQWKPDIYEKGKYELTVEVVDGSFQPTNESIARYSYEIVNGPSWYIGWNQLQKEEAGTIAKVKNFVVATGQVLDVWGSVVKINGGLQRAQSITQAQAANTVYRLGAGNYNIEWAEGTVYVGLDSGEGHHLWEAQKNYAVTGTSWQVVDLRDPNELPTSTPTSTPTYTPSPSSTPTSVDTTTPTATEMMTVTSTPVIEVTPTPTLVPNPVASSTPTLTLTPPATTIAPTQTPTATLIAATLTPTATEIVAVPSDDCPCVVLLPLIQRP